MGKERAKEIIESAETNMYKYKAVHDIDMWGMYKQKQVSILAFAVNNKVYSSLLSPFILGAEELKKSDSVSAIPYCQRLLNKHLKSLKTKS